MPLTKDEKQSIIGKYQAHGKDSGSPEVQIALLTKRVEALTDHFKVHGKDRSSRRGLIKLLNQRRRQLNYLKNNDFGRYRLVVEKLGLRK